MKREYKLIMDRSYEHFVSNVSISLSQGWQLAGGVCVTIENLDENDEPSEEGKPMAVYHQAIHK